MQAAIANHAVDGRAGGVEDARAIARQSVGWTLPTDKARIAFRDGADAMA